MANPRIEWSSHGHYWLFWLLRLDLFRLDCFGCSAFLPSTSTPARDQTRRPDRLTERVIFVRTRVKKIERQIDGGKEISEKMIERSIGWSKAVRSPKSDFQSPDSGQLLSLFKVQGEKILEKF